MTTSPLRIALSLVLLVSACAKNDDSSAPVDTPAAPPPPVITDHAECILSVDCPSGAHCDLGQCVQDCNESNACAGGAACSPRAHCLPQGTPDVIAPPSTDHPGDVSVSPSTLTVAEEDGTFTVTLTSTSAQPVRFRVETPPAHLHAHEERGEFTGTQTLTFDVDRSALTQPDTPATLRVRTTLGDVAVIASVHRGPTGYYEGALRYDVAPYFLGDASIAIAIREDGGALKAQVDDTTSLLFPLSGGTGAGTGVPVTGSGHYTASDGTFDVTLSQAIDTKVGGARNFFRRPILRTVHLTLKRTAGGMLEGDFVERDQGLVAAPIEVHGHAQLRLVPSRAVDDIRVIEAPPGVSVSPSYDAIGDVFAWQGASCADLVSAGCAALPADARAACQGDPSSSGDLLAQRLVGPLLDAVDTKSFTDLATACEASLAVPSASAFASDANAQACGRVAPLACLLEVLDEQPSGDKTRDGRAYVSAVAHLLQVGALIASEHVVDGLHASFTGGARAEKVKDDQAFTAMSAPLTWVLQPRVLHALRTLPATVAAGDPADGSLPAYPAASALAGAVQTLSSLDADRARLAAADGSADATQIAREAQQRALVSYLEAVTTASLLDGWHVAIPSVTSRLAGTLASLDRGFGALAQGSIAVGVPRGFVPFFYRPEDAAKAPTNFEQVYLEAERAVTDATDAITAFENAKRDFDQDQDKLRSALLDVRTQYDARLFELCGSSFDIAAVTSTGDFSKCGTAGEGRVASVAAALDASREHALNAVRAVQAKWSEIQVSLATVSRVAGLRADNIMFLAVTGSVINALTLAQGILNAITKSLETAAQAQLWNLGLPVAEGSAVGIIQGINAALEYAKDTLRLLQSIHAEQTSAEVEYVNGMAAIQRELIELAQLHVQTLEEELRVRQARIDVDNALAEAKQSLSLRAQADDGLERSSARDPSVRVLRDQLALRAARAREGAQTRLVLAGRALEYELDMSLTSDEAALGAMSAGGLKTVSSCLLTLFENHRFAFGNPQDYVTTTSVRRLLGIVGPRTDTVTGQILGEGEALRQALLQNQNLDGKGGVGLEFATTLQSGNGLWSDAVCNDRITSLQAQLVGDFLGDNQAQIEMRLDGVSLVRACDRDAIDTWSLGSTDRDGQAGLAVVQAGVNTFGDAPPNTSLYGQSVARATWHLIVPGAATAPENADIDLTHVDDIVLKIAHRALPRRDAVLSIDTSCLNGIP